LPERNTEWSAYVAASSAAHAVIVITDSIMDNILLLIFPSIRRSQ